MSLILIKASTTFIVIPNVSYEFVESFNLKRSEFGEIAFHRVSGTIADVVSRTNAALNVIFMTYLVMNERWKFL